MQILPQKNKDLHELGSSVAVEVRRPESVRGDIPARAEDEEVCERRSNLLRIDRKHTDWKARGISSC